MAHSGAGGTSSDRQFMAGRGLSWKAYGRGVSGVSEFESCHPSQPVQSLENLFLKRQKGPPIAGFSRMLKFSK